MRMAAVFEIGDKFHIPVLTSLDNTGEVRDIDGEAYYTVKVVPTTGRQEQRRRYEERQGNGSFAHNKQLLSVRDVMRELGMGASWTYKHIRNGDIPSIKVGNNFKVRREDLMKWIEQQRV